MDNELDTLNFHSSNERKNAWMITFADLLALMLTFFVLLYSMSTITQGQWEELVKSLQQRLNPSREILEFNFTEEKTITKKQVMRGSDLDYLYGIIREKLVESAADEVTLLRLDDRVVISLASDLLFSAGSSKLSVRGERTLGIVADIVSTLRNKITVNGHSDPSPIKTPDYPSNWELSLHRANTIAQRLYGAGYLYSIDSYGMADSRFDEIDSSYSAAKRKTLARRVDIEIRGIVP